MTIEQAAVSAEPSKAADGGLPPSRAQSVNLLRRSGDLCSDLRSAYTVHLLVEYCNFSQNAGDSGQGWKMSTMILVAAFEFAGQLIGGLHV